MTPHRHVPRAQEVELDDLHRQMAWMHISCEPDNCHTSGENCTGGAPWKPVERAAEDLRVVEVPPCEMCGSVESTRTLDAGGKAWCVRVAECIARSRPSSQPVAHPAPAPREISDAECDAFVTVALQESRPYWSTMTPTKMVREVARQALQRIDAAKADAR